MAEDTTSSIDLATELTIAWLSNPNTRVSAEDIGSVLQKVHQAVRALDASEHAPAVEEIQEFTPAVTPRKSLASNDHIISLIDGKPYKTLKRHLAGHGLTPDQYRDRYSLKPDYPMVARNYAERRRQLAMQIGLGRKPRQAEGASAAAPAKPRRGRPKKAEHTPA